jgi:hypothetical protein
MKKLLLGLAASISACMTLPAEAVRLSTDGTGQVLLFPYYTVNSGNQTLISIVNSTDRGKATRLFFREGRNSRVVMEVTIYLAPFDVWTGSVFSTQPNAAASLVTLDNSCTVPALKTSSTLPLLSNGLRYASFSNAAYTGNFNDAGPDDLVRTREGHFELIEMGEVTNDRFGTLNAITHAANGVPPGCQNLIQAWEPGGYWLSDQRADLNVPRGGLYGSAFFIDAFGGTMQTVAADALENFSERILHEPPATGRPTLADANTPGAFNAPIVNADVFVDGLSVRLEYPLDRAIDAVSAVLMADSINNEYVTSANVGGVSEWVITFPTKRFYTDINGTTVIAPFTSVFAANANQGSAPEAFDVDAWTRAGVPINCIPPYDWTDCIIGTPPPIVPDNLNWASNVVGFNQTESIGIGSSILGSTLSFSISPIYNFGGAGGGDDGAARVVFWASELGASNPHQLRPDLSGRRLHGLPVQGFWVASYTNGQLVPGVLSNYSDAMRHQSRVSLSTGSL